MDIILPAAVISAISATYAWHLLRAWIRHRYGL